MNKADTKNIKKRNWQKCQENNRKILEVSNVIVYDVHSVLRY